jgi:RNA polymerase sigma-70 factor, ECF subfamily
MSGIIEQRVSSPVVQSGTKTGFGQNIPEKVVVENRPEGRFGVDGECDSMVTSSVGESESCEPQETSHLSRYKDIVQLYHDLRPMLYAYLSTLGVVKSDAEELIQEGFFRLMRDLSTGNEVKNPRGWLFRVAHNLAMDAHRSMSRDGMADTDGEFLAMRQRVDPDPDPEEVYSRKERRRRVVSAIQSLTSQQRECLLLRAQGRSYCDIGVTLGVSTQRAAFLVQRSLVRLADLCDQ